METRQINLPLDTARRWYEQGGELKDMALGVYTLEELGYSLPKTFEEFLGVLERWNIAVPEQLYNDAIPKIAAVKKLILLRNFYNNHWNPEWGDLMDDKYAIDIDYDTNTGKFVYSVMRVYKPYFFLVFNNRKYAEEFLENFRELIEQAGDLI